VNQTHVVSGLKEGASERTTNLTVESNSWVMVAAACGKGAQENCEWPASSERL